jgi:outer membrane protein OmpA-like peptidoglycan-associated protein
MKSQAVRATTRDASPAVSAHARSAAAGVPRYLQTAASAGDGLAQVGEALAGPGQPLDGATRRAMQARLGRELGHVRLYTDAAAALSAQALAARAYTVGHRIAFARDAFAPHSEAGRTLLAHELAHTADAAATSVPPSLRLGGLDDPAERSADGVAAGVAPIRAAPSTDAAVVRRAPGPGSTDMGAKTAGLSACRVHFVHARAELKDAKEFDRCMKAARAYLKAADASANVLLYGFASDEGTAGFNQTLSEDRARSVAKLFAMGGVPNARIEWFAYGADATYPAIEDNRRVEVVLLAQTTVPPQAIQGTKPGPVKFDAKHDQPQGTVDERLDASIAAAASIGLPVKFLREVQAAYSVDEVASDEQDSTNTLMNEWEFRPGVLSKNFDPTSPGVSPDFGTLFHEGTHAYIEDLMSDIEPFASARQGAESYYESATVGDDEHVTKDPSRLAAEAAAEYVDHRVQTWWMAYATLAARASRGKLTAESIEKIRKSYNEGMGRQAFGYDDEGGVELPTSTTMDPELAAVLDARVLEGKIPNDFDSVAAFAKIIAAAKAKNQLPP